MIFPGASPGESQASADPNFTLHDGKGRKFGVRTASVDMLAVGNGLAQELTFVFSPPDTTSKAEKLVYSGRRSVVIDIPFTLTDVPLR
jgi:hypothetical protein